MRKSGMPYSLIAKRLGISKSTVEKALKKALAEMREHLVVDTKDVLTMEIARLDDLHRLLYSRIVADENGETPFASVSEKVNCVEQLRKISEHRAKLLGLFAPDRKQVVTATFNFENMSREEIAEEARRLGLVEQTQEPPIPVDYRLPGECVPLPGSGVEALPLLPAPPEPPTPSESVMPTPDVLLP